MSARSGRRGPVPSSGLEAEERWARVAWSYLAEPAAAEVVVALESHGAVGALALLREGRLGCGRDLTSRLGRLDLDALVHAIRARGAHVIVPDDPEWPGGVDRHERPPYCLYVRGERDLAALTERAVSIVGSRAASDYGLRAATELAEGLSDRGYTVISGAAHGIDGAAHRGALACGASTVALLACGVDVAYPRAHAGLLDDVARGGAVVAEVPIGCAPYRSRFIARNRLIATLARATVVVEASLRSGSLVTAREARDHHLPVGAVPGPVSSVGSAGCHALIRDTGAVLVTDAGEAAELAGRIGEHLLPGPRSTERLPEDDLDPTAYAVWSAVPLRRSSTTAQLSVASGVGVDQILPIVAVLEAEGLVLRIGDRWRKARPRPSGQLR
jgi:DNA processing protein